MNTFTFERGFNKKGVELIDGYKMLLDNQTSSFVKEAIEKAFLREKALNVRTAVKNKVSIEEFTEVVSSYEAYLAGITEMQEAAIVFVENNIPASTKTDVLKGDKKKIIIQKRIGLKSSDFQKYFATSEEETRKLYNNGFAKTFVDTRIRKCITDVVNKVKSKSFNITLSECFKAEDRNLYNIAVDFEVPIDKLNSNVCKTIIEVIALLEISLTDFTT